MSTIETRRPPQVTLYDLLARHWELGAAVTRIEFDAADDVLAFALSNGHVAVAPVADPEPPESRYRMAGDTGRATISARRRPVPALPQLHIDRAPLHLAPFGEHGLLAGGGTGRLMHLSKDCLAHPVAQREAAIEAIAPLPHTAVLVAAGGRLEAISPTDGIAPPVSRFDGTLAALTIAPDGQRFAIAVADGLSLCATNGSTPPLMRHEAAGLCALCWSPDGRWLAAGGLGELTMLEAESCEITKIPNYPAAVGSLRWSGDSRHLVTSGGYRIIVWSVDLSSQSHAAFNNVKTGRLRPVTVTAVGLHPRKPLVAAGYADGLVVVAQIGGDDELLVKGPGHGAVRALDWSHDGEGLGLGTDEGHAAIVALPAYLFK
jgi:WD40 repeat protein